jgi:hypothetical protein
MNEDSKIVQRQAGFSENNVLKNGGELMRDK